MKRRGKRKGEEMEKEVGEKKRRVRTWEREQLSLVDHLLTPHPCQTKLNSLSPPEEIEHLQITKHRLWSEHL